MLERLIRFLKSARSAVVLMMVYAVVMALATVVEKQTSTAVAKTLIYYSPLFILLHVAMVANFVMMTIDRHLFIRKRWPYVLIHGAFVVILIGASVTHFFSREGMMALREGERSRLILVRDGGDARDEQLPFEVELLDFRLERYPGSNSPSSYESTLRLHLADRTFDERVYMNHVLDIAGYRFFQASYDPDEGGSILSVSYDVTGRRITYFGYVVLFVGLVGLFFSPSSRFRRLARQLRVVAFGVLFLGVNDLVAQPQSDADFRRHAERFGELAMQSADGRIIPVNTFSSQLARKLKIKETFSDIHNEEFLLKLLVAPNRWANEPIILVEDQELREVCTSDRFRISYRDAFDEDGRYRWGADVEHAYRKSPAERTHLDRELLKLDEKVNLLHQLFNFQLVRLFPRSDDPEGHHWHAAGDDLSAMTAADSTLTVDLFQTYRNALIARNIADADRALDAIRNYQRTHSAGLQIPEEQIVAEARYNRQDVLPHVKRAYLILGGFLLLVSFMGWFTREESRWLRIARHLDLVVIVLFFALHAYNMGQRWYISGHVPWSNSYETMVFLAWVAVGAGLIFACRSFITFALSVVFGGVVLFVSSLSWMDPEITPLVPVLKSPWLMFHVATLMVAYGFLGLAAMISTLNLVASAVAQKNNREQIRQRIARLSVVNELALTIGLALMMVGIFLGAVWANESWGRYWSWDPKETWALITAIVYAVVLHLRWFERKANDLRFSLLTQLSFLAVLMTYFGVNYLLSGMHAYGNTSGLAGLPWWIYTALVLFFVVPGTAAYLSRK